MVNAVDHINIVVSDLKRSQEFYVDVLGFKLVRRAPLSGEWIERIVGLKDVSAEVIYLVAAGGEPRLELLHYISPAGASLPLNTKANTVGLRHIAFKVTDIDQAAQKLKDAGVKLFSKPVTVPSTVIDHDDGQKTLVYFSDPDGVILELAQYE